MYLEIVALYYFQVSTSPFKVFEQKSCRHLQQLLVVLQKRTETFFWYAWLAATVGPWPYWPCSETEQYRRMVLDFGEFKDVSLLISGQ